MPPARRLEERILRPRGLSLHDLYVNGALGRMPNDLAIAIDESVATSALGLQALVTGVDDDGAHIFSLMDPGISRSHDAAGHFAVGQESLEALVYMDGVRCDDSFEEATRRVYGALRYAVGHDISRLTLMASLKRGYCTAFFMRDELLELESRVAPAA